MTIPYEDSERWYREGSSKPNIEKVDTSINRDVKRLHELTEEFQALNEARLTREKEKTEHACKIAEMLVEYISTDWLACTPARHRVVRKVRATIRELRR